MVRTCRAVTVDGLRLSCEVSGDPALPPVVLLHALGQRATTWAPVTAAFDAAVRAGTGGSGPPGGRHPRRQLIRKELRRRAEWLARCQWLVLAFDDMF